MTHVSYRFLFVSLLLLLAGMASGMLGGLQYIFPHFLDRLMPFARLRPLHVTCVVTWIFTAAAGGIYHYLPGISGKAWSKNLARSHFAGLVLTGVAILCCYIAGYFGGREYLEFPPVLGIPLLLSWLFFLVNYVRTASWKIASWPVYMWMWSTGIFFFVLTLTESYLWLLPWFGDNIVRDVTVQWKALGAMVGCWNMLVYGTAFYVMEKAGGDEKTSRSATSFFFYFLGLVNLLFNWGHHTYPVPAASWIRQTSYIVSMTELLLLGSIIASWRSTLRKNRQARKMPERLLAAADVWIFLNLSLAIAISIPAINRYTHGTHITVAHAMGATIGINTMILLASLYFIASAGGEMAVRSERRILLAFRTTQISLFVFWLSLMGAGITKAMRETNTGSFSEMARSMEPWFQAFSVSGFLLFIALGFLAAPLLTFFSATRTLSASS